MVIQDTSLDMNQIDALCMRYSLAMRNNEISVQIRHSLLRLGTVRSSVVYILLAAWLSFSVTGIIQHCCRALASGPEHTTQGTTVAGGTADGPVNGQGGHGDDGHCPQLTSIDAIAPAELLLPDSPYAHVVVASYIESDLATISFTPSATLLPPLPPWRLYLSTQRLRI